jgi:hypothetical protein
VAVEEAVVGEAIGEESSPETRSVITWDTPGNAFGLLLAVDSPRRVPGPSDKESPILCQPFT